MKSKVAVLGIKLLRWSYPRGGVLVLEEFTKSESSKMEMILTVSCILL